MDLFRIKKSIKIFMCTVLTIMVMATCALSFSFVSSAQVIGLDPGIATTDFLSSLYSMLLTGKFVMDSTQNPFQSNTISYQLEELDQWFDDLNSYRAGLGDDIKSAIISGTIDGSIYLDEEARQDFLDALDALYPSGVMPVLRNYKSFPCTSEKYTSRVVFNYHTSGDPTIQTLIFTITSPTPYFFVRTPASGYNQFEFKAFNQGDTPPSITFTNTLEGNFAYVFTGTDYLTNSNGFSVTHTRTSFWVRTAAIVDSWSVYTESWLGNNFIASDTTLADMYSSIMSTGEIAIQEVLTATKVDTTEKVISTTSTVDENADITGGFDWSVVPYDTMISILTSIKNGVLKFSDAVRALRLGTVSDTATTQDIVDAINHLADTVPATTTDDALIGVLTVPGTATDTLTDSVEQVSTVQHIAHSIANTIADIRGVPRPYPDEDPDVGPSGDPYLNGWEFPSLDPDNPDPGGTDPDSQEDANRAADVVKGLAFVSGFIGSFYNASKGYNMVFTVGISFVIFSVIIGASHFFGALMGTHDINGPTTIKELEASRERQIKVQQRAYQKSLKHKRLTG